MCNPVGMALLGAAQANAANAAQNRMYGWKKRMEEAGEANAFLSNAIQQRQLGTQTQQKMRSVNEEIQMISRKGNQVAATAAVRATKGGVQADSASVQALQQQFGKDAMQAIGVRDVEGQGILTMSQQQAKAIELQTQARIDSVQAGPAPDKGAQFLNLAMGAAQGYMMGKSLQGGITPAAPAGEVLGPNMLPPSASPAMHNFGAQQIANPFIAPVGPAMVNPLTLGGASAQLPQLPSLDLSTVSHATRLQQPLLSIKPQDGFFNPYNMDNWQFNNPFAGFRF